MNIQGEHITLRALEHSDIDFLYALENDTHLWLMSTTMVPFSKYVLQQYLAQSHLDIFEIKQLRLVIDYNGSPTGCIDLFDFDPQHHRAGVGIVVLEEFQQKGFAKEALELLCEYAKDVLQLHQLFANITIENKKSIKLFEQAKFVKTGEKLDWIYAQGVYLNEYTYQRILK